MARRPVDPSGEALRTLAPLLESWTAPEPPAALADRTLALARAELATTPAEAPQRAPRRHVPAGYAGELARLLGLSALPILLALAWNAAVVVLAWPLLAAWLPVELAALVLGGWALGALGWLALATGSLPFLAHRRALTRLRENP